MTKQNITMLNTSKIRFYPQPIRKKMMNEVNEVGICGGGHHCATEVVLLLELGGNEMEMRCS
jgi:hypothetical protein